MPTSDYNKIATNYSELIKSDPVKVYAQYPSVLYFLKNVKNKKILDIGCGDGILARALTKKGAKVVAFDNSKKQIDLAKKMSTGFKIDYLVSSPAEFKSQELFDKAISTMVLIYANGPEELKEFFTCAYQSLKPGGTFLVLTIIYYKAILKEKMFNRKFTNLSNNKIKIEFFYGDKIFSTQATNFYKNDYEKAAKQAGFKNFKWQDLIVKPNSYSKEFWAPFKKHKPWKIIILKK